MSTPASVDDRVTPCGICQEAPSIECAMMACDDCGIWFHYSCVEEDESTEHHTWFCHKCLKKRFRSRRGSNTVSSGQKKSRDLELRRLQEELALQQEYMRKKYKIMASYLGEESDDDDDGRESARSSNVSSVNRTKAWIDKHSGTEEKPVPSKAHRLDPIPTARESNNERFEENQPLTSFGRTKSCIPSRNQPVPSVKGEPHVITEHPSPIDELPISDGLGSGKLNNVALSAPSKHHPEESRRSNQNPVPSSYPQTSFPLTNGQPSIPQSDPMEPRMSGPNPVQIMARQVWPKKLPAFSGAPDEWPIFISSYENSNSACGFSDVENLIRLQESLEGTALETVRSRLVLPANVPKVMETLRRVFGKPEILIRSLISKVRGIDPPKPERLDTVIRFGMAVQQLCDHLEAANQQEHLCNPVLLQEMVDKLPASFKLEWVRFKRAFCPVTMRTFGNFMEQLVEDASEVTFLNPMDSTKFERKTTKEKGFVHTHNGTEMVPGGNSKPGSSVVKDDKPCAICSKPGHRARNCEEFKKLSLPQRLRLVETRKLCALCLYNHGNMRCRNKFQCNVAGCNGKHHYLLHRSDSGEESSCMVHHKISTSFVTFRVIPVSLINGNKRVDTYAFLDEGSSKTLLEKDVAMKLGLKGTVRPLDLKWTSGVTRTEKTSMRVNLTVAGKGLSEQYPLKDVHTIEHLNLPRQSTSFGEVIRKFQHLQDLFVADFKNAEPTILIGLDNMDLIAPIESRIGKAGEPVGLRCKLGWTISGPGCNATRDDYCGIHLCDEVMDQVLKNYFTMEEAGINCPYRVESDEDRRARSMLETTTVRIGAGFETGMLWKLDDINLPDSYHMAYRRLQGLEKRFKREPDLREKVWHAIEDFIEKGYAHKATSEEISRIEPGKAWYLPLNVVTNTKKPGKIRLTLDAAAKAGGISLNDMLLKGPDMLVSLLEILNCFRGRRIGFGGDIREMFLQIKMREPDKRFQKFLFRLDSSCTPDIYVMDVVIFGAKCSPCNAHFTKDANAREHADQFPDAANAIINRHYVDDYFDSADTEEEAIQRAVDVRYVHSLGGFEIRNWVSNSPKVLAALGEHGKSTKTLSYDKTLESERVLGLLWKPEEDVFTFTMGLNDKLLPYLTNSIRPTKRIILQCVMSFFDPIGFLSPLLIHGRIIIQETWRSRTEWDQSVTDELFGRWLGWTKLLSDIEKVRIPRCFFGDESINDIRAIQLHIFSDAGEDAYGCVAYLRYLVRDEIRCALVGSKAKVAPLKLTSTPRLELQAAVIGARLMNVLKTSLPVSIQEQFLWVDSTTVLSWIRSDSRKYKPYVAHRVAEILHTTDIAAWRYVPSRMNIADDLTKWGSGTTVDPECRWFLGPPFLHEPMESWPEQPKTKLLVPDELKPCYLFHHIVLPEAIIDVTRISKWKVLLRTIATVYRFISNCKRKWKGLPIEAISIDDGRKAIIPAVHVAIQQEELCKAEHLLWRMAQADKFADEVKILKRNKDVASDQWIRIEKSSPLYKMSPFLDEDCIIRMEGRTAAASFAASSTRFPVILPRDHVITKKIVEDFHVRYGHASKEIVVNEIRQAFFVPKLRAVVGRVIIDCLVCKLRRCKPVIPRMAPLPIQRMQPYVRAFSYVGLDYCGPIDVTVGRRTEKRYVALFTCLVVRAVHCEIAFSLSTESCILAIRRFIRRRGSPIEIFTDNGTNFQGASRELKEQLKRIDRECADTFTDARTKWNFNPPSAPHMGGVWERMVRSVKEALVSLSDGRKMNDDILMTTLAEAEHIINSRPLTYSGTEDNELDIITPNHFLHGNSSGQHHPFQVPISLAEELRSSYKRTQVLAKKFWDRWCKEYFPTLNQRSRWYEDSRTLKVGDLVLVMDDGKGGTSIRGIVDEVFIGQDGRIRQALVRTTNGCFRRPVAKLAILELGDKPAGLTQE
ncbi:uncharacterized protein LOC129773014 [Toxorhynchites rutilus septentrionalis]|uniref:uncharacterized protein LOC129773014 n=1 Tax=Toxorhynchites rutilus septentrionalis TaxID=329112 RepID=UPI00247A94E2|nr:uncharacterized protein LOC129773014 [Toxorhynchites rutilus septentrionalis]